MTNGDTTIPLVRLWCVTAPAAPIVGVFARCYGGDVQWTCVLRWNIDAGTVEEGAWTKLRLSAHRCFLSPDGEFLYYHGTGHVPGPFSYGSYAVSRLPWVAALTYTQNFVLAEGRATRDALTGTDQTRLWSIFDSRPADFLHGHWPAHLGHEWCAVSNHSSSRCLVASVSVPDSVFTLVARVRPGSCRSGGTHWSIWEDQLRYSLVLKDPSAPPIELPGVRWAAPAPSGRVLVAMDAKLQIRRVRLDSSGTPSLVVEFEHDLSSLKPCPSPAPAWAKAPLPSPE